MSSTTVHLRPRSIPELVDAAVPLLRRHYMLLVTASAVVLLPALVLGVVLPQSAAWVGNLVKNLFFTLLDAAVITIVSDVYIGHEPDLASTLRAVGDRSGSLLGASFIRGLIVGFGFLLLVVPGVVFFAWSFAMPMVIMLEGHDAGESFSRSRALVRGHVWRVLGTLLLAFVIVVLLAGAASVLVDWLAGLASLPERTTELLDELVLIAVYPIGSVIATLLYYDLRIRNEGFDLEVMAQELEGPSAHTSRLPAT